MGLKPASLLQHEMPAESQSGQKRKLANACRRPLNPQERASRTRTATSEKCPNRKRTASFGHIDGPGKQCRRKCMVQIELGLAALRMIDLEPIFPDVADRFRELLEVDRFDDVTVGAHLVSAHDVALLGR